MNKKRILSRAILPGVLFIHNLVNLFILHGKKMEKYSVMRIKTVDFDPLLVIFLLCAIKWISMFILSI